MFLFFEKLRRELCSLKGASGAAFNDSILTTSNLKDILNTCKAYTNFLCVAEFHEENKTINMLLMQFLSGLAELEVHYDNVLSGDAIFSLIQILYKNKLNLRVHIYGYEAVAILICDHECDRRDVRDKHDSFITTFIKGVKPNKRTQTSNAKSYCNIISVLALCDFKQKNKPMPLMIPDILGVMQVYPDVEMVQLACCASLQKFTNSGHSTSGTEIIDILYKSATDFDDNLEIICLALSVLNNVCENSLPLMIEPTIEKWLALIYKFMQTYNNSKKLQELGCISVSQILTARPESTQFIGNIDNNAIPLHNSVVFAIMVYSQCISTLHAAINAVYCLAIYSDNLKELLKEKGVFLKIMESIRDHSFLKDNRNDAKIRTSVDKLILTGVHSMKYLCEKYSDMLPHLHDCQVIHHISGILNSRQLKSKILDQCLSFLSIALDYEELCIDASASGLHSHIVITVNNYLSAQKSKESIINNALDCLLQMASQKGYTKKLNEVCVLELCIKILAEFQSKTYRTVMRKSNMLLTLLADETILLTDKLSLQVAEVLIKLCKKCIREEDVMIELLTSVQKLSEADQSAANEFVNVGIHSVIFQVLAYSEEIFGRDCREILELASDVLYTLSCLRDLKNQMLSKSIEDGMYEGVVLLVSLGADTNSGNLYETPLCRAVASCNRDTVIFLLRKGASDINNAFKFAIEKNLDEMVGLLVAHMAKDRDTYGEVHMNGMNLKSIKAEWFLNIFELQGNDNNDLQNKTIRKRSFLYVNKHFQRRRKQGDILVSSSECEKSHAYSQSLESSEKKLSNSQSHSYSNDNSLRTSQGLIEENAFMANLQMNHPDLARRSGDCIKNNPIKDLMFSSLLPGSSSFESTPINAMISMGPYENKRLKNSKSGFECSISAKTQEGIFIKSSKYIGRKRIIPLQPFNKIKTNKLDLYSSSLIRSMKLESTSNVHFRPISPTSLMSSSKSNRLKQMDKNSKLDSKMLSSKYDSAIDCATPSLEYSYDASDSSGSINDQMPGYPQDEFWAPLRPKQIPSEFKGSNLVKVMESLDESEEILGRHIIKGKYNRGISLLASVQQSGSITTNDSKHKGIPFKKLVLSNNGISEFKFFNIQNNEINFHQRLISLEHLDLQGNKIMMLEDIIFSSMKSLTYLNLTNNKLLYFPLEALRPPNLLELNLNKNSIGYIPKIEHYTNLRTLSLAENKIEIFPDYLGKNFPDLENLILSKNQIEYLPKLVSGLNFLQTFEISDNKLQAIHLNFLCSCSSLEKLSAANNKLASLPEEAIPYLQSLEIVKLSKNNFGASHANSNGSIPELIISLTRLRILDMKYCGITSIPPPHKWESRVIKDLILANNQITVFPLTSDCQHFWPQIERINLSCNKLKELPKQVGLLHSLSLLDISHNPAIARLPLEVGKLSNLFGLNLSGLNNLEISLHGRKTREIVKYLQARLMNSVARNRAQIFFVGHNEKDKNNLFSALTINSEKFTKHLNSNSIIIQEWRYTVSNTLYTVQCWNFKSNVKYLSAYQIFYSERAMFIILYDIESGSNAADQLRPWLLSIYGNAPRALCVLVGTYRSQFYTEQTQRLHHQAHLKIKEMISNPGFPDTVQMVEVSVHPEGNDFGAFKSKLRELLENTTIRGDKLIGQLVPESYLFLEKLLLQEPQKLQNKDFPILKYNQILTILQSSPQLNKLSTEEIDQALLFMHQCKITYQYSSANSVHEKLYIFNPNWLCQLGQKLLNLPLNNPYINKYGILHEMCFRHLFQSNQFPKEYLDIYKSLIEQMGIGIPTSHNELLIPLSLPLTKPIFKMPFILLGSLVTRRVRMAYTPMSFWGHYLGRLITITSNILQIKPLIEIWQNGAYFLWSEDTFLIIETLANSSDCFDIIVPKNKQGYVFLSEAVDHLNTVIDEWFLELREHNIRSGKLGIEMVIPCPICIGRDMEFTMRECVDASKKGCFIYCAQNDRQILLDHLIPDLLLLDIEDHYFIPIKELNIDFSDTMNLLGKGGFGEVYKSFYRDQPVALKTFSTSGALMAGTTLNHLLREEATILRKLNHPNLIGFIGVCLKPEVMLIMDLAKHGNLTSFQSAPSSNLVKHSIGMQVVHGIAYMHENSIVYRDLKPDNVMIFSISQNYIHVKIVDYGIACVATSSGLNADIGTAGYKAPEVLKARYMKQPYNCQADIYSYGMVTFSLFTQGHKPFEELSHVHEIDRAIEEGRPIEDLIHYGYQSWPDLQDLIDSCFQYSPNSRPTSRQIASRMKSADFLCLKRSVPICQHSNNDVITTRSFINSLGEDSIEFWMVSLVENHSQLAILNLADKSSRLKGKYLGTDTQIFSIISIESHSILMGSKNGIIVYDGNTCTQRDILNNFDKCVFCFAAPKSDGNKIYAGTANGEISLLDGHTIKNNKSNYLLRTIHISDGPIFSLVIAKQRIWACSSENIYVIRPNDFTIEREWKAATTNSPLANFTIGNNAVWTFEKNSSIIQIWDLQKPINRGTIDCKTLLNNSGMISQKAEKDKLNHQITCLYFNKQDSVWVGTNTGYLMIIDPSSRKLSLSMRRHHSSVRNIVPFVNNRDVTSFLNHGSIITTGNGFIPKFSSLLSTNAKLEYSYVLIWDSCIAKMDREIKANLKKNSLYASNN